MVDFNDRALLDYTTIEDLDQAQERGFQAFLSDIGHNAHSSRHRDCASRAVKELEGSLRRNIIPDYSNPYIAAAYMVSYHLEHCALSYWVFKNLFGSIDFPDTLYVCDVGAGTGAGRVGLLLVLSEYQKDINVYFDAYEPSEQMLRAGNRFWEAFRNTGKPKPGIRYRESLTCPVSLPDLPGNALQVVTAFHLSLPYNGGWSPVFDHVRESVQSVLGRVSPDVGLFTCHQNKDAEIRKIVDSSSRWDSKVCADFAIPNGRWVNNKSRFYTHSAGELGFDVPEYEKSLYRSGSYRFSMPSGILLLRGSQRYAALLHRKQEREAAIELQRQLEAEERERKKQAEREERERQRRIEAERLAAQRAEEERRRREEERKRQEALDGLWAALYSYRESGEVITAEVVRTNKGGLEVNWEGLPGFVPFSHCRDIASRDDSDALERLTGRSFEFNVLEIDRSENHLKLTRTAIIKREIWETLHAGQVLDGMVVHTAGFGAFVRVAEAVEGLVHISELAHGWVSRVTDVVSVGQSVKVRVISVETEKGRLSLSIKNALPDPWDDINAFLSVGDELTGKVKDFEGDKRLVVDIGDRIEGRIHVSEMGDWGISDFHTGVEIQVSVLRIDSGNQRIWLRLIGYAA